MGVFKKVCQALFSSGDMFRECLPKLSVEASLYGLVAVYLLAPYVLFPLQCQI
jgi:hypothetical protein